MVVSSPPCQRRDGWNETVSAMPSSCLTLSFPTRLRHVCPFFKHNAGSRQSRNCDFMLGIAKQNGGIERLSTLYLRNTDELFTDDVVCLLPSEAICVSTQGRDKQPLALESRFTIRSSMPDVRCRRSGSRCELADDLECCDRP